MDVATDDRVFQDFNSIGCRCVQQFFLMSVERKTTWQIELNENKDSKIHAVQILQIKKFNIHNLKILCMLLPFVKVAHEYVGFQ